MDAGGDQTIALANAQRQCYVASDPSYFAKGSCGVVYEVTHKVTEINYAIKAVSLDANPVIKKKQLREADVGETLLYIPFVVNIVDTIVYPDKLFIVMERCEKNLKELLIDSPDQDVLALFVQVAIGLEELHFRLLCPFIGQIVANKCLL
jgi:serine/threonine protein kinase